MIRTVARASVRLTATSTRSTVTPFTSVLLRTFATTPSSSSSTSSSASSSTSLSAQTSAPAPANLRSLRRDLSRMLDEDAADLSAAPDPKLLDYIREEKYKIAQDKDTGLIRMTRQVGDYQLTVTFSPEVDEALTEEGNQAGEGEEGEEGKEAQEAEGGDEERLPAHSWEVELTSPSSTPPTVRLHCTTSKQGQMSLETIDLAPAAAPTPETVNPFFPGSEALQSKLFFEELSEGAQDKLFDMLEGLGVDDRLGQFVQHYAQVIRTQGYLDKLKQFKAFLQ